MQTFTAKKVRDEAPLLFITSVSLLVTIVMVRYGLIPQFRSLATREKELAHFGAQISSESGYALIKKEIREKQEILEKKLSNLEERETITADPGSYLETLISVARKADIRFVRVQPQEESRKEDVVLYPVLLELTTTYHELGHFVAALEKLPHLFRIDRCGLESNPEGKCDVRLLVTCLIPRESK